MPAFQRKTKIICTIGPRVDSRDMLEKLIEHGMDVARLNFSHGNHGGFKRIIKDIRDLEKNAGRPIGIMADIQGPKIRVGELPGGEMLLETGAEVWIVSDEALDSIPEGRPAIRTTYKDFVKDLKEGLEILLDDGLLALKVEEKKGSQWLRCSVVNGGLLRENKGINVPEVTFSVHAITEKDYSDILFCLDQNVDFIALSFVRTDQEVRHLKEFVKKRNKPTQVLAKIEMKEAISQLNRIVDAADGILVARGDLAVEVGAERVPVLQKKIVRMCNLRGKTVMIATQMLMSMVENPRPTRAEASDVANAILDGTDAVMLSNETAVGNFPLESVEMMSRIILEMEHEGAVQHILYNEWQLPFAEGETIALLQGAVRLASIVKAKAIVILTDSGRSARLVSKCRPQSQVFAITSQDSTFRQFSLNWGVESVRMEDMLELIGQTTVFEAIGQRLLALNKVQTGDKIVITAGLPRLEQGSTNTIKVHQI